MSVQTVAAIRLGDGLGDFIAFTSDAILARSSDRHDDGQRGGAPGGKRGPKDGSTPKGGSPGARSGGNH